MSINIFEMVRGSVLGERNEKREMYNFFKYSNLRLEKYIKESGDFLNGKRYIPEVGPGYCSLTVVNEEQNIKEELYYSGDLSRFNYKLWAIDFSIEPIKYSYVDHRGCLIENANRILGDVNTLLEQEDLCSD